MTRNVLIFGKGPALMLAAAAIAACEVQPPATPAAAQPAAETRVDQATTRLDHERLAADYEIQAANNAAAARRHERYAAVYRRNTAPDGGRQEHLMLAERCEGLAAAYQKAADESLALATLHRRLAVEAR